MTRQSDEIERLIRIRDQQIQARDPLKKQDRLNREVVRRRRQAASSFSYGGTIGEMFASLSHKLRGLIYGLILGTVASVPMVLLLEQEWALAGGLVTFFTFPIIGFAVGAAFDWRDSLRDEIRR